MKGRDTRAMSRWIPGKACSRLRSHGVDRPWIDNKTVQRTGASRLAEERIREPSAGGWLPVDLCVNPAPKSTPVNVGFGS